MRGFALSTPVAAAAGVASVAQWDQSDVEEFIETLRLHTRISIAMTRKQSTVT